MKILGVSVCKVPSRTWSIALPLALVWLAATCETDTATTAQVENGYASPKQPSAAEPVLTVYRVWYQEALFVDSVAPGELSGSERIVPGSDYAYALVAVNWDPSVSEIPDHLIALRSAEELAILRGNVRSIVVEDGTFVGNCFAEAPLPQEDADFITERIFVAEFAGVHYDAASCTSELTSAGGAGGAGGFAGSGS